MKNRIDSRDCSESSGVSDEKFDNISRPFQDSQIEFIECTGCLMKIRSDGLVVEPDLQGYTLFPYYFITLQTPVSCILICVHPIHLSLLKDKRNEVHPNFSEITSA